MTTKLRLATLLDEPAAKPLLADLAEQVDSGAVLYVTHPGLDGGEPVRLHRIITTGDDLREGCIGVVYVVVDEESGDDEYVSTNISAVARVTPADDPR